MLQFILVLCLGLSVALNSWSGQCASKKKIAEHADLEIETKGSFGEKTEAPNDLGTNPARTELDSNTVEAKTSIEQLAYVQSSENQQEFVYDPALLLPPEESGKKYTLVLDLDETLIHSGTKPKSQCDFVAEIAMDGITYKVYVLKRPGVDEFLKRMSKNYELVIFTGSLEQYAKPLIDLLDPDHLITGRLFRQHCTRPARVKDLGKMGRPLKHTVIVDNSPGAYALHRNNAVPILSWFDDPDDTELTDMIPFLEALTEIDDVSEVLDANTPWRLTWKKFKRRLAFETKRVAE